MKIKKINAINNVGIIDNSTLVDNFLLFKDEEKNGQLKTIYTSKVLIRGDNGTGKSTLSNIFRSIEEKEKTGEIIANIKNIENLDNVEVNIELDNGTIMQYDSIQKKWINDDQIVLKVFNDDYIKENINLEEFEQNKIDGKFETKDIEISSEKKEYEESNKKIQQITEEGKTISKIIKEKIDSTNLMIKEELDQYCTIDTNIDNYNEKNDEKANKEKEEELKNCVNGFKKLKNSDKFNIITLKEFVNTFNIKELIDNLKYTEDATKIDFMDEILSLSAERKKWMDMGMLYIEDNRCPFCKNDISKNHFINEYKKYKDSNSKKIEELLLKSKEETEKIKNEVLKDINILAMKNKEYKDIVEIKQDITEEEYALFEKELQDLINIINEKLKNVSKAIDIKLINAVEEKVKIFKIIEEKSKGICEETSNVNKVMLNAKKELTNLRLKIKNLNKDILEYSMIESIIKRRKLLKDLLEEKNNNKIKKEKYEKKVEDSDLTIKEMNTWLEFFGMNKYKVDKDFNLKYKENNISNKIFILSTGEISALAFSYYLSTLITGLTNEEKQKLIIIIDDPVNSLDYNKIYSFATAIKIIQKKISESNAPQLFLFTHNMLFFNILVQTNWMKSKNAKVFELYKDGEKTKIRETKNYKDSLFVVQLSEIIKCANSNVNDIGIEKAYIYNDIRAVIENLCYLINPKYVDNDDKYSVLSTIFDLKNEEYMKLDYIINNNSHNEPMLNIEKLFDAEILYGACKIIANMINSKFSQLYNYCLDYNIEKN